MCVSRAICNVLDLMRCLHNTKYIQDLQKHNQQLEASQDTLENLKLS